MMLFTDSLHTCLPARILCSNDAIVSCEIKLSINWLFLFRVLVFQLVYLGLYHDNQEH